MGTGPADYVLFIGKKPVGVIEAKPEDWGQKITTVEEQSAGYAAARRKWANKSEPLPFVYEGGSEGTYGMVGKRETARAAYSGHRANPRQVHASMATQARSAERLATRPCKLGLLKLALPRRCRMTRNQLQMRARRLEPTGAALRLTRRGLFGGQGSAE